MAPPIKPIDERFWKFVRKTRGCWEWNGYRTREGYGRIWYRNIQEGAHRVSIFLATGRFPVKGEMVCHTCDNPACVNPKHLYFGNVVTNAYDCVMRKRHVEGRKTHCKSGHKFSRANTYMWRGERHCRTCRYLAGKRRSGKNL